MNGELDLSRLSDPSLRPLAEKVLHGERLNATDGSVLYATTDLLGLGMMADFANRRRNGNRVFFSANQHINPTNVCVLRNTCVFCSFARMPKEEGAYTRSRRCTRKPNRHGGHQPASSTSSADCTPSSGSATTRT